MGYKTPSIRYILYLLTATCLFPQLTSAITSPNTTGDQTLSFIFSFTPPSSPAVVPITKSCPDPLYLSPITVLDGVGADPVAPYYMMFFVHEQTISSNGTIGRSIYTKTVTLSNMKDAQYLGIGGTDDSWNLGGGVVGIPWMNVTTFIACVWASNGVSGGCQDLFTVIPSDYYASGYATPSSSCRQSSVQGIWIPPVNKTLTVKMEGASGIVSEVGWPPSCTDLRFTPSNGKPPYTLIIAPTQHPPINITSTSTSTNPTDHALNYTIRYTHGQAFMAAMIDSAGNSWAVGPLHAGFKDDVSCLAIRSGQKDPGRGGSGVSAGAIAGATVAALLFGILAGWFGSWFQAKRKRNATPSRPMTYEELDADPYLNPAPALKPISPYVTPYGDFESSDPYSAQSIQSHSHYGSHGSQSAVQGRSPTSPQERTGSTEPGRNVYVVHADGGDDLHIRLPERNARVIEMPPDYRPRTGGTHSGRGGGIGGPRELRKGGGGGLSPAGGESIGLRNISRDDVNMSAEAPLMDRSRGYSSGGDSPYLDGDSKFAGKHSQNYNNNR